MFRDRADAGRQLAQALVAYRGAENAIVLAIPRGGAVVGYYLALELGLPLDLIIPRKIGAPGNPELAIGAIVDGDHMDFFDEGLIRYLGVPSAYIEAEVQRQVKEMARRYRAYRGDAQPVPVNGKKVLVTDDGVATGYTMKAAIAALRRAHPAEIVLAIPVAPAEIVAELKTLADKVTCLLQPVSFGSLSAWYEDFHQVSDAEVKALVQAAQVA